MSDFPDEDHEKNAPGLEEALEEIFENEDREELEGLMDPVDADDELLLEIEPVSLDYDPYGHSTMPYLTNTASFTKVPNVEIVGEQIPAPSRTRMYGNARKPVADAIPSHVFEDELQVFKYIYDNENDEESILDIIVVATNIRMKKIYPNRPKGNNDSNDIYYTPVTKKELYSYLGLASLMSGWRGKRVSQRKFYRQLQQDPRLKDFDLMPLRRYEVIHNSLDIGENEMVDLLVNGQPRVSRTTGRPIQVLDLKKKYEGPFQLLNKINQKWDIPKDGIFAIDERLSKSYLYSPNKGKLMILLV